MYLKAITPSHRKTLQSEVVLFHARADRPGLILSYDKCPLQSFTFNYFLNDTSLNRIFLSKDLGIHPTSSLSPTIILILPLVRLFKF